MSCGWTWYNCKKTCNPEEEEGEEEGKKTETSVRRFAVRRAGSLDVSHAGGRGEGRGDYMHEK